MGMKDKHTKHELETQRWQAGTGVASSRTSFQNLSKMAKINPPFWAVWVPRMSMEGCNSIGTGLDDEQKPLILV